MKQVISLLFLFLSSVIGNAQDIVPLLNSSWHQEAPFNNYIPNHMKAGCGPIAVAQILNYYEEPKQGFGHVTLYNDLDYSNKKIDYNLILNDYRNSNYTSEQADAVANLVWHVAAAMTIKYHENNNATENNRMVWGIQKYLHISQKCRFRLRKFYSTEQWIQMLDQQLESGRPVYYRGRAFKYKSSQDGIGHVFVIDGKQADGVYHANFGKNTKGYNKHVSLDVLDQSTEEGAYPGDYGTYYNWEQGMATDLYPDKNFNEDTFNDYPVYLAEPLSLNNDKSLDELTISLDEPFYLSTKLQVFTADYIKAKDGSIGTWEQALGVYKNDQLLSVISSKQNHSFSTSSTKSSTLAYEIPTSISDGEYEIRVVTKRANADMWQPVWDIAPNTIYANIKKGKVTLRTMGNHTLETKLYLLDPIKEVGEYVYKTKEVDYSGRLFSLKIKNPTDNNFENKINLSVVVGNVEKANLEQMASVYSGCQVEYRFLIPYEVFDFRNSSNYKIKASYYEQNEQKYIDLTTDIPDLSDIKTPQKSVYPQEHSVYSINGVLLKHLEDSDTHPLEDLPRGCYIIKEKGSTRKVLK
jgi:hypothetical protein